MKRFFRWTALFVTALLLFGCSGNDRSRLARKGINALNKGKTEQARTLLEKATEGLEPEASHAPAYQALGLACWKLEDREAARDALLQSLALNPELDDANYNLGCLLMEMNELVEARQLLTVASQQETNSTAALEMLASIAMQQQEADAARRYLHEALQRETTPRILTALGVASMQREGTGRASHYFSQALQLDANYAPAHYNFAVLQDLSLNQPEKALKHYEAFVQLNAESAPLPEIRERMKTLAAQVDAKRPTPAPRATATPVPTRKPTAVPTQRPRPTATPLPLPTATPIPALIPDMRIPPKQTPTPDPLADTASVQTDTLLARARHAVSRNDVATALNLCLQAAATASRKNRSDLEERAVKTAVAFCPDHPRAHFALARFHMQQKQPAEAMVAYRKAADLEPTWTRALQGTAEAAIAANEYQVALQALRQAVDANPADADVLYQLGTFYMDTLDVKESALRTLRQFQEGFRDDDRIEDVEKRIRELEPMVPTSHLPSSTPLIQSGTPESRLRLGPSTAPRTLMPRPGVGPVTLDKQQQSIQSYNEGTKHHRAGRFDEAMAAYKQALDLQPDYTKACYNLALIHHQQERFDEAEDLYKRALKTDKDNQLVRFNLGSLYHQQGNLKGAENILNQVLKSDPEHAMSHYLLGAICAKDQKRKQEAKDHYQAFLKLDPDSPHAPAVRRWIVRN